MNVVFTRFLLYKQQHPYSTPSRPFVALSQFTKEAFHFLSLMETFKGGWLLPRHFQMQDNEAGWFLREALVPSSLVNCRHLTSIDQALTVMLCSHLRFPWEWHETVWLHSTSFPTNFKLSLTEVTTSQDSCEDEAIMHTEHLVQCLPQSKRSVNDS